MAKQLALGDLLDDPDLGLELAVGGEGDQHRPVCGAHSIEVANPSVWLERDWVMLTAGIVLQRNTGLQRQLIAELDEAGIAALGFGVGVRFQRIPRALLDEARRRRFPVFSVPFATSFRQVEGVVNRSLLSSDLHAFRRLATMQHYLLDSFGDEQPVEAVIERLARLVDASVAIIGAGGRLERHTGPGPWEQIWAGIQSRPHMMVEFDANGSHSVVVPIRGPAVPSERWLVVTRKRRRFTDKLTKSLAQITAPLLAALTRLDETEKRQEQATRASLLESLLHPLSEEKAEALGKRLDAYGFDPREPSRVLAIDRRRDAGLKDAPDEAMMPALALAFESMPVPYLLSERQALTVVLVQGPLDQSRALVVPCLEEAGTRAVAGCGRAVTGAQGVGQSMRDAELILSRLPPNGDQRWRSFEDIDLDLLLVSEAGADRIQPKVDEILERLSRRPGVLETVRAYFENDLDVGRTALALGLHPNSVRYRLSRAEDALGRPLRTPSAIASISIALAASSVAR